MALMYQRELARGVENASPTETMANDQADPHTSAVGEASSAVRSSTVDQSVKSKLDVFDWALTSAVKPEVSAREYLGGTSGLAFLTAFAKASS